MCWLFLLYFSLSTSHPPPAHSSPQVGFNSGYFLASCGAQPVGATNRTSECGKRGRLGHDPLVSSLPGYTVWSCLNPTVGGSGSYQAASCIQLFLSSNNCSFPLPLESGMVPHMLHYPWLVFLNLASTFISDLFIKYSAVILLQ